MSSPEQTAHLAHSTYARGREFVTVRCDACGIVLNSGYLYDSAEPYAQMAADKHNQRTHVEVGEVDVLGDLLAAGKLDDVPLGEEP